MPTTDSIDTNRLSMIHLSGNAGNDSFAEVVREGLTSSPKTLPSRYLYDAVGSQLFEQICELPEYYLTRTEDEILNNHAATMVSGWSESPIMFELGSGSSTKTRRLIDAALKMYGQLHYVPTDISPTILEESVHALGQEYEQLQITGMATDYGTALSEFTTRFEGPKLIVFLGSSLGNFDETEAMDLLQQVSQSMNPEDRFLFGSDLVKEPAILEAAYDDAQGVTRTFNKNILARMNRELGSKIDLDQFRYVAKFVPERQRVEMYLISVIDQIVQFSDIDLTVSFSKEESIHTENSHKYTPEMIQSMAEHVGLVEESFWLDDQNLFRVQRWKRVIE